MKDWREKAQCEGKITYETPSEAHKRLSRILKKPGANRRRKAYRCSSCGKWHIGQLDRDRRKAKP